MKKILTCDDILKENELLKTELLNLNSTKLQDDFDYLERIFHATPIGIGLVKERAFTKVNLISHKAPLLF
jgi:hypothetical protein